MKAAFSDDIKRDVVSGIVTCFAVAVSIGGCRRAKAIDVEVYLECPSPDRSLAAVLWGRAGGGAAGWSETVLSVQPTDVSIDSTPERTTGDEAPVLSLSGGNDFSVKWNSDERLTVSLSYADRSSVYSMSHQYPRLEKPRVRLNFVEVEPSAETPRGIHAKCQSGELFVIDPPVKKIR